MPSWMPGSNAISVKLSARKSAAQRVGLGLGHFRVAEDGTVSGSVTTKDVAGTMAHIHRGAKGTNGPVIVPLDKSGDTYSVCPPGASSPPSSSRT